MRLRPVAIKTDMVSTRWQVAQTSAMALSLTLAAASVVSQTRVEPLTLVSPEGRWTIATVRVDGLDMVSLEHLAVIFKLATNEDRATGSLTVSYQDQHIVLSPEQGLVSVAGRLVDLPSPPVRTPQGWLVPVEFIGRALAPIYDQNLELRRPSRLVIVGEVRIPQITVREEHLDNRARVNFEIAPATDYTVVQEGGQVIVQFEADVIDAILPVSVPGPLVAGVRIAEQPNWVAIDLGPAFDSFRATALPAPAGAADLIIDLLPTPAETANTDPPIPTPFPAPPRLPDLAASFGIRTIVIDPGHGGEEPNARGPGGTFEKDVTLSVARRLKNRIEQQLGLRVVLTRNADQTVRLDERAAVANNNKADLFISLHANASTRSSAMGAEVYYLSLEGYGDEARQLATSEGQPLAVVGGGIRDIDVILWEMAQVRYLEQSAAFAEIVEEELRARVRMSSRAIQQAPFRVLVGANMPAVLVEMGFISNPVQERQLTSDQFQRAVVDALVASIIRFRGYLQRFMPVVLPAVDLTPAAGQPRLRELR